MAEPLIKNSIGTLVVLRLNRPAQANALNSDLFARLKEELEKLAWDQKIRAVIITGEGKKAFCDGGKCMRYARRGSCAGDNIQTKGKIPRS